MMHSTHDSLKGARSILVGMPLKMVEVLNSRVLLIYLYLYPAPKA